MANAAHDIANMALRMLRAGPTLSNLSDAGPTGETMNEFYDDGRRWLLEQHPWNFAIERKVLNADAVAPPFGFSTRFVLPTEPAYLWAVKLNGSEDVFVDDGDQFKIEGRHLLTDASEANLVYVKDITDVPSFSPGFTMAFAGLLAWWTAYNLTGSRTVEEAKKAAFDDLVTAAKSRDSAADFADSGAPSPFINPKGFL